MAIATTGQPIRDWLLKAGLDDHDVCRVVVDMRVGDAVRVYIERYGSRQVVDAGLPECPLEVKVFDADSRSAT